MKEQKSENNEICKAGLMWMPDLKNNPSHIEMLLGAKDAKLLKKGNEYLLPLKGAMGFKQDSNAKVLDKKNIGGGIFIILFDVAI